MGVIFDRSEDNQIYMDAYNEAQRIIRISKEVRISLEKVDEQAISSQTLATSNTPFGANKY